MSSSTCVSIYFANVPPGLKEAACRPLFERAGPVLNFRMITDKGDSNSGYVDYTDPQSAQNAVSQLNGKKVGNLALRVTLADRERKRPRDHDGIGAKGRNQDGSGGTSHHIPDEQQFKFPATDPMLTALNHIPVNEAYEALEQLRLLSREDPQAAAKLLDRYPQLAVASVLVLQHAGRIPCSLPEEAQRAPDGFVIASESTEGEDGEEDAMPAPAPVTKSAAASATQVATPVVCQVPVVPVFTNAQLMEIVDGLDSDQLSELMEITPEALDAIPDRAQRAQMKALKEVLDATLGA